MPPTTWPSGADDYNTHVVFGLVIKEKVESILYNGVACLGPEGDLVSSYHKVHLLREERQVYRSGFRFVCIDADWGRFGLMIGSDLVFPEAARSLTLDGAELLVLAANWEAGRREQWRSHVISRAAENAVFVAAANRVGEEPTMQFAGDSLAVGPDGQNLHRLRGGDGGLRRHHPRPGQCEGTTRGTPVDPISRAERLSGHCPEILNLITMIRNANMIAPSSSTRLAFAVTQ